MLGIYFTVILCMFIVMIVGAVIGTYWLSYTIQDIQEKHMKQF